MQRLEPSEDEYVQLQLLLAMGWREHSSVAVRAFAKPSTRLQDGLLEPYMSCQFVAAALPGRQAGPGGPPFNFRRRQKKVGATGWRVASSRGQKKNRSTFFLMDWAVELADHFVFDKLYPRVVLTAPIMVKNSISLFLVAVIGTFFLTEPNARISETTCDF